MADAMKVLVQPTPRSALPGDGPVLVDLTDARTSDGAAVIGQVRRDGGVDVIEVVVDGWRFELAVEPAARAELRRRATRDRADTTGSGRLEIRAVIPGRVVSIAVSAGDAVAGGQALLVLEAMKMQNELRAPRDGRVANVAVAPGATVELGDTLMVLE